MSNRMIHIQRSFREIALALTSSDWLEVDFGIQRPAAADTSHIGTIFDQSESRIQDVS